MAVPINKYILFSPVSCMGQGELYTLCVQKYSEGVKSCLSSKQATPSGRSEIIFACMLQVPE